MAGVTVRVRGGNKIRRFVFGNLSNPQLAASAAFQVIQRVVMPQLRALIPERSGRLKKTIRVVRIGTSIELRGVFYANFARVGPRKQLVRDMFLDLVARNEGAIRQAIADAQRNAGG